MMAALLGLGTWQIKRLAWKRGILDQIARAEQLPAALLTASPSPFEKVTAQGRFLGEFSVLYGAEVRETPAGPRMGGHLLTPLARAGSPLVLVDRGWIPDDSFQAHPTPDAFTRIEGYVRPPDKKGPFSLRDDPATRRFYTLNPDAIGAELNLPLSESLAPFVLVAVGPRPPGLFPDPARHLPRPPNNHLWYAITWYGLALSLAVVFAAWARRAAKV